MGYSDIHISVRGSSHIKKGIPCQDSSLSKSSDKYGFAIVCDGHGDNKHFRSDIGSELACECCEKAITEYLKCCHLKANRGQARLKQLEKNIIYNWNNLILENYNQNPFTEQEMSVLSQKERVSVEKDFTKAYGTTLVAVVMAQSFTFGIQIGDGDCLIFKKNGEIFYPVPEDEQLQFNVTTSLCAENAIDNFRDFWMNESVYAAVVTTDGVMNSFSTAQYYAKFCSTVVEAISTENQDKEKNELKEFLKRLSADGSNDDMSISVIKQFYEG